MKTISRLHAQIERAYPEIHSRLDEDRIHIYGDFPTDRNGDYIASYYNNDYTGEKYCIGIIKHFQNFLERNGYWIEWQNSEHLIIWPNN